MVNLIKILPLILTLTMACNSMETIPQSEKAETEKLNPKNNDVNSNGNDGPIGEEAELDLDKDFVPLEYEKCTKQK